MGLSEEKKIIECINDYIKKKEELGDLGNDFTINFRDTKPLKTLLNLINNQQKEIEEKTTIIMAGAEKVKQLEKEIEELKEKNAQLTNYLNDSYYVSADKIKEKIDKYRKKIEKLHSQELWNEPEDSIKDFKYKHYLEAYKELLEEK